MEKQRAKTSKTNLSFLRKSHKVEREAQAIPWDSNNSNA